MTRTSGIRTVHAGLALAAASLTLWGCGSYPLPKVYVLGDSPPMTPGVSRRIDMPVIELRTVSVPDYLDTTDILRRTGPNQVVASPTGQWADRLSVGVTQALVSDLSARLPKVDVETRSAYEPARRLLVDIERFEIAADGQCTLVARWRMTSAAGAVSAPSEGGTFVAGAGSGGDADDAAAMTHLIDQLADRVAMTVRRGLGTPAA
jgi:uncharacterized lipoprotein YmbA